MKRSQFLALLAICIVSLIGSAAAFGAKTVKIKLTGTAHENIRMMVGTTGRTEVISDFPYVFEVPKDQMPVKLTFESPNYLYYPISVPKKPFDTTGHVYLVKMDETAMALRSQRAQTQGAVAAVQQPEAPQIEGVDMTRGVNAAPVTGNSARNTYALIIANEHYEMAANVDNATNDGSVFKEYCLRTLGLSGDNVKYYTDLSYGKMRKALNEIVDIARILEGEAHLIIYYAGHGIPDNKTKDAYIMPVDADGTDTDICLSLNDFYSKLNSVPTKQCVVLLDACFSGAQRNGDMIMAARGVRLKPQEAAPQGSLVVFSATSGDEAAFSHNDEQHGLFTYYFLKCLQESKGKADLGTIADYVIKNVGMQSRLLNNMPQTPTVTVSNALSDRWRSMKLAR